MLKLFLVSCLLILLPVATFAKGDRVSDAFGMNLHLRQRIHESDWNSTLQSAEDAGVQWGREEFNWNTIEPSDGTFDFSSYDEVADDYDAHNIKMLGLLTYSSSWAASSEFAPPDAAAWENYVSTVAQHYAGQIDTWEIWNEPNYDAFWTGTSAEYAELITEAAEAIKAVNPDAKIVLGGLSGADSSYLDTLYSELADPSIIDVVAIHPYRTVNDSYTYAPEATTDGLNTLQTDIYNVLAVIQRHGQTAPIWLTEMGWPTSSTGVTETQQADYLQRMEALVLSIPKVQKIFWYTYTDTNDANFGLVNDAGTAKPAYSAYQFMVNTFDQEKFMEQILPSATTVSNFSQSQGWQFSGTVCTNGTVDDHDHGKLTVTYQFTSSTNCYAPITFHKQLANPTRALQFRAKGEADDTQLRVRILDATGETFQYSLGFLPHTWLFYTVQLGSNSAHWGGNNDSVIDQPITFDSLLLDDTDGSFASGTVQFDNLESSAKANVYEQRWRANHQNDFAYWTSGRNRTIGQQQYTSSVQWGS